MKSCLSIFFIFLSLILRAQVNNTNSNTAPQSTLNNAKILKEEENKSEEKESLGKKVKSEQDIEKATNGNYSKKKMPSTVELKSNFTQTRESATHQNYRRSPSMDQQIMMNEVVSAYEQNDPNSFEFHYFKYLSGNYNLAWYGHLEQAKKLKPNNLDVAVQLAAYHYMMEQDLALKEQLNMLFQAGKIESELLIYAKHVLQSMDQDGVLITHGFDDTYSVLYVQKVQQIRTDVNIISLDFLQSQQYRSNLEAKGLRFPIQQTIDVQFLTDFCSYNQIKNIQLSMTIPKPYVQALVNDIGVLGLTFKYDVSKRDNREKNEMLWQQWKSSQEMFSYTKESVKKLSSNYLPFLFYLRAEVEQSYSGSGAYSYKKKSDDDSELNKAIDKISIQSKQQQKVKAYK